MTNPTTLISPAEYLATRFPEREPEYVRGEIRERPMPDSFHGAIQAVLTFLLMSALAQRGFEVRTEVRCRLRPDVFLIPDVAVFGPNQPFEALPNLPPFAVVEIVSKDESHTHLLEKLEEYRDWGVPHIWVVDPWRRRLAVFDAAGLHDVEALTLPEHGFEVRIEQLIKGLPLPERRRG